MRLVSEKKEKSIQFYEVEVPLEKVEAALTRAFHKVVRRINMPGFRKGKAPRSMVERRYGVEILYEDAIDYLLPDAYEWVIEEFKPEALDKPEVNVVSFTHDASAVFSFAVPVKPEVVLGQYKGVKAVKRTKNVDEADIEAEMQRLREEHARLITVTTGTAQKDDTVTLDFEGLIDGEAFEGGKGEDYSLLLGSGRFIPGFEDKLIGSEIGVALDVDVIFPEDYRAEHLAGKPAVFKCIMKDAKRKELLPLDDEFAQEVSEYDTLAEWKDELSITLRESAERECEDDFRGAVVKRVSDEAQMDVPNVLIERQIDQRLQNFSYSLMRQGISFEDYLRIVGRELPDVRNDFREVAEQAVRQMLTIESIGKAEQLEPSEEDMDSFLTEFAEAVGKKDDDDFIAKIKADPEQMEEYRDEVRFRATVDMIVKAAVPIEESEGIIDATTEETVVETTAVKEDKASDGTAEVDVEPEEEEPMWQ